MQEEAGDGAEKGEVGLSAHSGLLLRTDPPGPVGKDREVEEVSQGAQVAAPVRLKLQLCGQPALTCSLPASPLPTSVLAKVPEREPGMDFPTAPTTLPFSLLKFPLSASPGFSLRRKVLASTQELSLLEVVSRYPPPRSPSHLFCPWLPFLRTRLRVLLAFLA